MPAPVVQTCPGCGANLDAVALDPDSAPFACQGCSRGWWRAELTRAARLAWNVPLRCHDDPVVVIRALDERDTARRLARTKGGV